MKKVNKCFTDIFIIAVILFTISLVMSLYYELQGTQYINVNADNRDTIMNMLENSTVSTNGEIARIGQKSLLGDWDLYVEYKDGSNMSWLLNEGVDETLRSYIIDYGVVGGTYGVIARHTLKVCFVIMLLYAAFQLYFRNKKQS